MIYKICSASAWREAERQAFTGSADDIRDGLSIFASLQVAETPKRLFGQAGLFLIAVDADALGEALRWEPSRNDELFRISTANSTGGGHRHPRYARAVRRHHDIPELAS
jgi:uncharacterized protein (DUF952 family)